MQRDVYAIFTYLTAADLSRIGDSLMNHDKTRTDPLPGSLKVPGWHVRAYVNEGYTDIHKYTRIADEAAARIALAFDNEVVPAGDTSRPLRDHVHAINVERDREKRERLAALPAEIARLQREERRLADELASGGER